MDDDRHKQFIIQLSLCSIQDLVFFRFTPSFIGKTHCPISGIERLPEHISRFSSWYMYIETQPNSSGSEFNWTGWFFDFYTLRLVFRQNDDDWYDGLWTVQIIRDWMVSVCVCVHALVCSNKIVVGQIMPLLSASVNITSQYTVASFMLYSSACCAYVRRRCRFFCLVPVDSSHLSMIEFCALCTVHTKPNNSTLASTGCPNNRWHWMIFYENALVTGH